MSKLKFASEEIQSLVKDVVKEIGYENIIDFQVFNAKLKDCVVKVKKASDEVNTLSDKQIVVYVYEDAFDRVDDAKKLMWLKEALNKVVYDFDKDKIVISKKEITVDYSFYLKHGEAAIKNAELAILTIEQLEEEERVRKEMAKAMKKSKK